MDNSEIGIKLFNSCVEPPLRCVITFTIFNFSGNTPLENDMFNNMTL